MARNKRYLQRGDRPSYGMKGWPRWGCPRARRLIRVAGHGAPRRVWPVIVRLIEGIIDGDLVAVRQSYEQDRLMLQV